MATPTVVSIADCEISAASPALSVTITCDNANYAVRAASCFPTGGGGFLLKDFDTPVVCGTGTNTITLSLTGTMVQIAGQAFPTTTSVTAQWQFEIIDTTTQSHVGLTNMVGNTLTVSSTTAAPTITKIVLSEGNSSVAAITSGAGFVKDKSDLRIAVTASGKCGASVTGYAAAIGAQSVSSASSSFDFGTITVTGNTVTVTITDSRGFTATKTKAIEIATYSNPRITSAAAQRKYMTPYVAVFDVAGKIVPIVLGGVKRNSVQSLEIQYKVTGASSWQSTFNISATEENDGKFTSTAEETLLADKSYTAQFKVTDAFGTTATSSGTFVLPITLPDIFCGNNKVGIRTYTPQTELDVLGVTSQNGYPVMGYIGSLSTMPANLDLNNVKTDGIYKLFYASRAIATTARHYPADGVAGILEVFSAPLGEVILQRYTSWYADAIYYRNSYNSGSTWSAWRWVKTESIPT